MAVRLDAAGDYLQRTASLPTNTAFTILFWFEIVVDRGNGVYQPLFAALNGSATNGFGVYWDSATSPGNMRVFTAVGGAEASGANLASRPAVGTKAVCALRCSGNGATDFECRWRPVDSPTWVSAAIQMGTGVTGVNDWRLANVIATYWSNIRLSDVKCWDRALSADEINVESYYFQPKYPASLNWWWPLHGSGDTADRSGNARNPTVGGTLVTEDLPVRLWRPSRHLVLPAQAATIHTLASGGTLNFTGAATINRTRVNSAGGTLAFSATADQNHTRVLSAGGELLLSGTAVQQHTRILNSGGELLFSGNGPMQFIPAGGALFPPHRTLTGAGT